MGTSTGYGMPTGGDWTPLKTEATKFVKDGGEAGQSNITPNKLLSDYLKVNGGAKAIAGGGGFTQSGRDSGGSSGGSGRAGSGGGGGSGGRGRTGGGAARSVGRNLGGFLSSVGARGLDETLRESGLEGLIGKSAEEVSAGLLDALAGPSSSLDEHAARLALAALNEELLEDAETYEDVGRILSTAIDQQGINSILASFFGHYLYERFCRDFYETWVKKVGSSQAARSLESIKNCIETSLKTKLIGRDTTKMNWKGREALNLTQRVMQEVLEIFEVTA